MNFTELFAFCKDNNVGISVRCRATEYDTEYFLRLRRGDKVADLVFDGSTLDLLKDPDEIVNERIEELIRSSFGENT